MKKLLSLVLSASMVLGSFGYAFAAPTDVEGTKYEESVNRLEALEILNGYEDGTFKPGKTITRAEFAKVMASTLGVGEAAKYAMGETKFNDVPASHWAAGYINVVSDMKVINGRGDGNFGPNDNVTYAEAITMIVRALGYEPKAKAMGGYPGGYLAVAAEEDITDDVTVVSGIPANRGDVSIMVDNSLTVDMMEQTSFGDDKNWEVKKGKTILSEKHDIDEVTGTISKVPSTDDKLDDNEFKIGNTTYELMVEKNIDELLGVEVNIWTNDDEEVFYVENETEDDDIMFDTVDADIAAGDKEITLIVEDDDFDFATDDDGDITTKVTINFEDGKDVDDIEANDYGYFVLNDRGDVASVNVFRGSDIERGFVYEIDGDEIKYVNTADATEDELDLSDYEDGVVIYDTNFDVVDEDAIEKNSVIYAFEDDDDDKITILVSNKVVEGELERVKKDEFKIDGENYDAFGGDISYSTDNLDDFKTFDGSDMEELDDLNGEEVVAVLDVKGDVVMLYGDVTTSSSTIYGVGTYGEMGSTAKVTVFDKDGNETDYKFEERTEGKTVAQAKDNGDQDYYATGDAAKFPILVFALNSDGEIKEEENAVVNVDMKGDVANATATIKHNFVDADDQIEVTTGELTKDSDEDYVQVGTDRFYISEDTVFITAMDGGELDPDTLTYKNVYGIDITKNNEAVVIGEAGKDADMIVFLNDSFEGTDDDYYYAVVTDTAYYNTDDDYVVTVDVAGQGEKEIVIDSSDKNKLTEGKIIQFRYDNNGEMEVTWTAAPNTDERVEERKIALAKPTTDGDSAITGFDYDDGYLEVTTTTANDVGGNIVLTDTIESIRVSKKVVLYKTDDNDNTTDMDEDRDLDGKVSVSKVDNFKLITFILNEDDEISAIVMEDEK